MDDWSQGAPAAYMREIIADGSPSTPFMKVGDEVRIEMLDANGNSIFGAIKQKVVAP